MSYLEFLAGWYNWLYLAALAAAAAARFVPSLFRSVGERLGRVLGVHGVAGHTLAAIFTLALGILGLTLNGALHDYWPRALTAAFVPTIALSGIIAAIVTRVLGRALSRHFPEIRAIEFGSRGLAGHEGRVVSRSVSPDYRAGRAQVMLEDGTLHMVLCKTRRREIGYGARVVLDEYDPQDGRYYVLPADLADRARTDAGDVAGRSGARERT